MNKKYDTICLDWDGVIWDFMQAFCDWRGVQVPRTNKWEFYLDMGLSGLCFHEILSELPQEFWEQEQYIMPHAHKLVEWAKANAYNVFVLTVAPECTASVGKQNLARKLFNLGVYTVDKAEEKVEFAKANTMLIDDKPSTVVGFRQGHSHAGGYIWPAEYNSGLSESLYFDLWHLESRVKEASVIEDVSQLEKADKVAGTISDVNLYDYSGKIKMTGEPYPWPTFDSKAEEKFLKGEAFSCVAVGKFDNVDCDRETKESENMKPTNPKDIAGSNKVPMNSMLSGAVMGEVALALFEGALKYGRHNYRQDGVRASVYYDAVGRHLSAWWEGEDVDEESGLSHITKAIAGLHILRDCSIRGMCNDDRPPKTADFMRKLNNKTKALIEKYPNPVPPILEKEQGECVPEDTTSEGAPYLENTDSETYYMDGSRSFTREFRVGTSDNTEFEWHRDHYDRRVRAVVNGGGWFIQFAGEEPVQLGKDFITIKKGQEHRLLFIQEAQEYPFDLIVEIFEYPEGLPEQSGCCGTGGCC